MSTNKAKYFEVTITKIVRADNKTKALNAASVRKPVAETTVLASAVSVDRISAADAHYLSAASV
jgi:hypothetical protein